MKLTTTLQNYRDDVKTKLHIATDQDNTEWSNAYLLEAINDARRVFWEKARYRARYAPAYFDVTSGTADFSLTTKSIEDIDKVRYYNGTRRFLLKFVPLETYLHLTSTSQSGIPYCWTLFDNEIKVYPTPAVTTSNGLEVWGTKELTDLAVVADIDTDIEARYRKLIVRYALGLCWEEAEQPNAANRHFAIFEKRFDEQAFAINSLTHGENVPLPSGNTGYENELSERRFTTPIG